MPGSVLNLLHQEVGPISLEELRSLHRLVASREIEDELEEQEEGAAAALSSKLCRVVLFSLQSCWTSPVQSEKEKLLWETLSFYLSLPLSSDENTIECIVKIITKDLCKKMMKSIERGIKEYNEHAWHILRWIYIHVVHLRGQLRTLIGSRLLNYSQNHSILKVVDINPNLKLLSDIIAGMSHDADIFAKDQCDDISRRNYVLQYNVLLHLLINVLLPLHQPNEMLEWRDQIPIIQLYHESLVRCVTRIIRWDHKNNSRKLKNPSESSMSDPSLLKDCRIEFSRRDLTENVSTESLLVVTVRMLLGSLWPEGFNSNTPKEVLFLHEVETLLELASPEEFSVLLDPVLNRLKISIMHENVRTIQRSLQFFRNELFLELIKPHIKTVVEQLMPALYRKGNLFWNLTVNKMTATVLKKLQEIDQQEFENCAETIVGTKPPTKRPLQTDKAPPAKSINKCGSMLPPTSHRSTSAARGSMFKPPSGSIRQQIAASSSDSSKGSPPVTVTGVAPWAFQHNPAIVPTHGSQETNASIMPSSMSESPMTGLQIFRRFMRRCQLSGNGDDVAKADNEIEDDMVEDENAPSTWSREQALLKPKLLPSLRFHDLVFGKTLGEGSFGVVKYGRQIIKGPTSHRSKWPEYAIKILSRSKLEQLGRDCLQAACREIAALHALSHPGIARLVSAFRYTDNFYLVLEYASEGDLHTYIIQRGRLEEKFTRFVVGEVCAALISIHDVGLAFNDLKPENILITEVGHIKLADFGACRAVNGDGQKLLGNGNVLLQNLRDGDWKESSDSNTQHPEICCDSSGEVVEMEGTPGYLPPEILSHSSFPGWSSDSWALGCVLYFCLIGRPKYFGTTFEEVFRQIVAENDGHSESEDKKNAELLTAMSTRFEHQSSRVRFDPSLSSCDNDAKDAYEELSPETKSLLKGLFQIDASRRLTLTECCSHSFFFQASDSSDSDGNFDPRSFHMHEALKLPPVNRDNNESSKVDDKAWARRQCSMVWNPMPEKYDTGEGGATKSEMSCAPELHHIFSKLEKMPIHQSSVEVFSSWLS